MQQLTRVLWTLFAIGVYAAVGMTGYSAFVGDLIDTSSAQFWAWLGAWPIMLIALFFGTALKFLLWGLGIAFLVFFLIWLIGTISLLIKNRRNDTGSNH